MSSHSLLPPNASHQERSLEAAAARFDNVPVVVREIWDAQSCPESLLPWLARAVSVDVWDPDWSAKQKRTAITSSLSVHRKKGTIGAVQEALRALGFSARIQEWFNQSPPAAQYTYRLVLESDQTGFSLPDAYLLLDVVNNAKNLRSHLTEIAPVVRSMAGPVVASASGLGSEVTITPSIVQEISVLPAFFASETLIDTLTNTTLAQTLENRDGVI
ncbi:MAG TPA: phage tail protein I, partial [Kineobactrum sp.]